MKVEDLFEGLDRVSLSQSPEKGRYLVARSKINLGEEVMESEPLALIVDVEHKLDVCNNCLSQMTFEQMGNRYLNSVYFDHLTNKGSSVNVVKWPTAHCHARYELRPLSNIQRQNASCSGFENIIIKKISKIPSISF